MGIRSWPRHLATLVHHGVNEFGDSGVSFVPPSIVNYYVRRWAPLDAGPEKVLTGVVAAAQRLRREKSPSI